jgi:processive 1,2-diacylglycerol beta-glucosyltransferase
VVSGFRAHHHWARPEADVIFVASDEAKADLIHHRIPAERIHVVGIPIAPHMKPLGSVEKARFRERFGLGEGPVILVSSGATGAYRALGQLLRSLEQMNRPIDVVTFKGPVAPVERIGKMRLWRLGFRDDFCDWLSVSDLVVGKLGGHTAAEAFAAGVPIVVYEPIPGQEEDNAAWVVAAGAAQWPRSEIALTRTISALLDPAEGRLARERMAQAAHRLARADAASQIVRIMAEIIEARA